MKKVIEFAHNLIKDRLSKDDISVDMTIGNGNDTLFLAKNSKFVYGFDIQQIAIDTTDFLLKANQLDNYKLILDSHEFVLKYVSKRIKACIFNLGYLPKGDKSITTLYNSSIKALENVLLLLDNKAIVVLVVYEGHEQGKIESEKLLEYVSKLDQKKYDVITYKFINQINYPPYVIAIERKN